MQLQDKVAVITGAGRGIGQAIALAYAKEGARLVLAARSVPELEETAAGLMELGVSPVEPLIVPTDVTDQPQVEALFKAAVDRFATVDILVNNAGISGPIGPIQENEVGAWLSTMQVNINGTFLCCRSAIPVMLRQGGGRIVNLSGAGGTNAWANMSAYCSSKAAVVRMTEVLALELADTGITVNALGPGSIHTRMWEEMTAAAAGAGATSIYEQGLRVTAGGGAPIERCAELAVFLAGPDAEGLSGRQISAVADDFENLTDKIPEIMATDAYLLRRVSP